ncbi:MAG: YdcF family protein [bacterium]
MLSKLKVRQPYRLLITTAVLWFVFVILPSFPLIRSILVLPLVANDPNAHGDAVYVLAGGTSFLERLAAASDLYHMNRVQKIYLSANNGLGSYNFVAQSKWTHTQWAVNFLECRGVPRDKILVFEEEPNGWFGTFSEAILVKKALPSDVKQLVIVTSAGHTRRSLMTFSRTLDNDITVKPYAATEFTHSQELYLPLWMEYLKLLIYWVIV